jgi:hypothetical protein
MFSVEEINFSTPFYVELSLSMVFKQKT